MRRQSIGMSQSSLGGAVRLTFQQIQKYEKGVNRISASCLFQLSQVLDVPVQFFFDGSPIDNAKTDIESAPEMSTNEFSITHDGLEMNRHFVEISDQGIRQRIINLVRALANEEPTTIDIVD